MEYIMDETWVKLMRSEQTTELQKEPLAFDLLSIIATRARRTDGFNHLDLKPGEALIGDYKNYGMTQKQYRTAKLHLKKWGLAAFKGTNKGTIATLVNNKVYDINLELRGEQLDKQEANEGRTRGDQGATNKNVKNVKNEKNTNGEFEIFWFLYPKKKNKGDALKAWLKLKPSTSRIQEITDKVNKLKETDNWKKDGGQFIPYPATWLRAGGWDDEVVVEKEEAPKKTKLFPISGRICGKPSCHLPAVYKDTSGAYDQYSCTKHLPEKVKELYE